MLCSILAPPLQTPHITYHTPQVSETVTVALVVTGITDCISVFAVVECALQEMVYADLRHNYMYMY